MPMAHLGVREISKGGLAPPLGVPSGRKSGPVQSRVAVPVHVLALTW